MKMIFLIAAMFIMSQAAPQTIIKTKSDTCYAGHPIKISAKKKREGRFYIAVFVGLNIVAVIFFGTMKQAG